LTDKKINYDYYVRNKYLDVRHTFSRFVKI